MTLQAEAARTASPRGGVLVAAGEMVSMTAAHAENGLSTSSARQHAAWIRPLPSSGSVQRASAAKAGEIQTYRAAVTLAVAAAAKHGLEAAESDYAITKAALARRSSAAHYRPAGDRRGGD
jgi:acyl-CoA dehydrogenase